jgi:cytochrome c553
MKKRVIISLILVLCISSAASLYAGNAKIPGIVKLDTISDKYEPVKFDHAKHASIAGNCGTCHHDHGKNSTLPCKDCHSISSSTFKNSVTNNFMACKKCHAANDPSNPAMPGLKVAYHKTCFECHRGMGNVGIDPIGCAQMCHAPKVQMIGIKKGK